MKPSRRWIALGLAIGLLVVASVGTACAAYYVRQYYSGWNRHAKQNYYYRHYYYKPTASYSGYRHHYCIYYPSRPQYYYFYNPYRRQYWGRCPVDSNGESLYSMLEEKDRKSSVKDIPESAFPKPTTAPPIPEATDDEKLDLPPDDIPAEALQNSGGATTPAE